MSRVARKGQFLEMRLAGVERGEVGGEFFRQRGRSSTGAEYLRAAARRENSRSSDPLQGARVELRVAQGLIERLLRLIQRCQGGVQRLERGLDERRRL